MPRPTLAAQVAAAEQLVVTPTLDHTGVALVVDAGALVVPGDQRPRSFTLYHCGEDPGRWVHRPSGDGGPLADVLRAIACLYLDRTEREAADRG